MKKDNDVISNFFEEYEYFYSKYGNPKDVNVPDTNELSGELKIDFEKLRQLLIKVEEILEENRSESIPVIEANEKQPGYIEIYKQISNLCGRTGILAGYIDPDAEYKEQLLNKNELKDGFKVLTEHNEEFEEIYEEMFSNVKIHERTNFTKMPCPYDDFKEVVNSKLFNPDDWRKRSKEIMPIYISGDYLTEHIQQLLLDAYRSYIYGNSLSCMALIRAILEYALIERWERYTHDESVIRDSNKERNGEKRYKTLYEIIDIACNGNNNLTFLKMDTIRNSGNEVLHPVNKATKNQNIPSGVDKKLQKSLRDLLSVIKVLYSE